MIGEGNDDDDAVAAIQCWRIRSWHDAVHYVTLLFKLNFHFHSCHPEIGNQLG